MNKFYILIAIFICSLGNNRLFAQLVDITYTVKTGNITGRDDDGNCSESFDEEYTGYLDSWDNVNGTWVGTGCQTCDVNGDCAFASNITLQNRTNNAYNVSFRIDAWEDDQGGRCSYDNGCCNSDDCRRNETQTVNIRESAYPSNSLFTNTPTWGAFGNMSYYFQYTWKYTGTGSFITPGCTSQSVAYSSGGIRSFSANLSTANTYRFSTCGSGGDTYIRIYGPDGYTIVAQNDDNGPACTGLPASLDFNPGSNGTYYIEISNASRSAVGTGGNLIYQIVGPYSGTASLGTLSTAGPVAFCDAAGNYGTAVSLSGYTNGLPSWEWGSNNGTWNNWVTGASAGNCCFPKKTSNSDGNADRIRVKVIGCTTTGYSSTVQIRNEWNEAPNSLSKNLDNVCPGTTVTLTANFPTATNMNGNVQFYSGSCGTGTLVATVAGNGTTSVSASITAPASTTTYFARYIGASGCGATACVSTILTINFGAPTATTATAGTCTQWRANWNTQNGATSYRLDVAIDAGFTSMVINNLNVGNVTSYDLDLPLGTYYYRIRSVNACYTSGNSNTITVSISNPANNDAFRNAIDITANIAGGSAYNTGWNNNGYSEEGGEPHSGDQYNSGWYKFTTPAGGFPSLSASISENGGNNSAIGIYQSNGTVCPFGGLTEKAYDRWCSANGGTVSTNCLPGNTTFYVQAATSDNFAVCIGGNNTGGYNISITPGTPSGKDNVCSAHDFGTIANSYNSGNIYYNNSCLGTEAGEQRTGNMSHTMWYKFRTPVNGLESVTIEFEEAGEGANYAAVTLYEKSGACSGTTGLTERAFERWCGANGGSVTYTCLSGNTDYYIQGGTGYNFDLCTDLINGGRSTGRYRLRLTSSGYFTGPDNVCSAVSMGTLNGTTASLSINNQSNICAGTQANEPGGGQNTVWYAFTTGATIGSTLNVNMDAVGNGLNADVYLYRACGTVCSGSSLNAGVLQEIGNWYDVNPLPGEYDAGGSVSGVILPNTTYYIRADGVPTVGQDGQFNLSVSFSGGAPLVNDHYCGAISMGTGFNYNSAQLSVSSNTDNASSEDVCSTNEPDNSSEKSLWYKFTTGTTPPAIITLNPSAGGVCTGQAFVYSGAASGSCTGNAFTNYNTATNYNGLNLIDYTNFGNDFVINCPAASTTYYVQVQVGGLCNSGSFSLTVKSNGAPKPTNDLCANAISLGTLTSGATLGDAAGTNRWNNFCAGSAGDPNPGWTLDANVRQLVWFKFNTGSVGRLVDIEGYNDPAGLGDQIDLKLALYKGPCTGTYVDRDYDPGFFSESMTDIRCLEPNTDYYILVDGSGLNTQGFFGLTVKDRGPYPANDLICGATTVPVQTIYTYNSTTLATESNVGGTNCYDPNPDWTFETGQDNDHGIWYYLGQVPGRTVVVDGNSGSNDIDLQYALYSSTIAKGACVTPGSTPALTEVQKEYAGAGVVWDEDAYFNCLDPAKYYWLLVDGSAGATSLITALEEGIFSIRFWNPEEGETTFCNAENIGTVPNGGSVTKLNLANKCGAASGTFGTSGTFTLPSGFSLDAAVVYKFTTPASGSIEVTATSNPYYPGQMGLLTGDELDLQLAVFEQSGASCSTAQFFPKGNNYDVTDGFNENLIVNCLLPNTVYYLMVDGSGVNGSGYFDVTIADYGKTTPNDFLCNAIDITATNSAPWTNCNSNTVVTETGENNYCGTTNNDIPSSLGLRPSAWSEMNGPVWYKFKAPKSGKLKIEANNSISDALPPFDEPEISAQLAVFFLPGGYQGNCTNLSAEKERLQYIGSNHDALLHDEEYTIECLMPDSIYYLLVDGSSETLCPTCTRGEFYIRLSADPRDRPSTNDLPCDAIDLGTPVMGSTIVDTKVSPAGGAATNPSPATGYPASSPSTLHGSPRTGTGTCMRAENNFCAGIGGEPGVSGGTFLTDFSPDATVWYSFTAPATGEVIIDAYNDPDSRGDQIDLQLAVYESSDGTCGGTLVPIKAEYNIGSFSETMRVQCLNPGQKYWILVDGSGLNTYGYFELQVQAVTATLSGPANDDICNATTVTYPGSIGTTTTVNNQTNRCATIQTVYSEPTTFTKDADVWYKFTTPNTAGPHAVEVTVTSGLPWPFGDAMDPQIALYEGTCPSSFTLVDDDYSAAGLPFYESFEFHCLEQNKTYYLMVDGSGLNEQGNFKLDVKRISPHPLAANDDICSVTSLATGSLGTLGATAGNKVGNTTTNWHNFCSDVESGEPALMTDGNYSLDQTVWFKFRTPNTVNNIDVEIRALNDPNGVGDQIDLQMLLVQGTPGCSPTSFTSLTPIESVDPALSFSATMNVCLPPNTDFYIQVDGSGLNTQGYFTLEIENKGATSSPVNDNICNAKVLPSGGVITGAYTGYLNDNNNCATLEANEKQQVAGSIQRSVWYKFVAPTSADVSIEVKGNSFVPFTQNYFLPDVTIWEVNDGTFASPATTIAGCAAPSAAQWNKLEYNDYQGIPNSLANGIYPTVVLTPLCLKPGYTYYVQVDGTNGIGLDGFFDIRIKNNQPAYAGPANNEASGAIAVPISTASCQYSNGTWQSAGGYSFGTNPTWSNPSLIGIASAASLPSCTQNCGDIWYKFQMPAACGNNTKSFVKIEGDDEFNLDINGYPELAIAAYSGGLTTSTSNLAYIKCSIGGTGVDPDFSISGTPGEWIYLQIWDMAGNEQDKTFKICVSEQKSADECVDATQMTLDVPYCWSVESHRGETPNSVLPGSGLNTCFGSGTPQHSTYFKFTTDAATTFCDDYFIYVNTAALAKLLPSGVNHACLAGVSSSVSLNLTLWELKSTGIACTPGTANVVQEDCITWNDCGTGSFGANTTGPHGNGGLVQDTIWYNLSTGQELKPNTTYYIVLDYNIDNIAYESRVVLDGTITVGRRCRGRTWEYTTAPVVSTDKHCTSSDGWRHYYDDKGTPATGDDRYIFSVFPNGNTFEGMATITLDPTFHRFEDFVNHFAEYVMRRRWDFQLTSGSINPLNPVKVRFYYQNPEKQEIITVAQAFAVNYPSNYEDFEWFKSENGHVFSPYTDVNTKVISVGPNGYSETGCMSYWNAAGTYVGPPGVQRCIQKVITDWDDDNVYHQWCNGVHFAEYNGLTGFSGGTGGTGDSPYDVSPLPVELISFTGYNNGSENVLNWTTAAEINTLRFEVQKSTDGRNFVYIGERPAAGNSSGILTYELTDPNPVVGNNYYRLKMVDKDGSFEYSNVIDINVADNGATKEDVIISVYPNPTNGQLNVIYQASSVQNINLNILNAIGQNMLNKTYTLNPGIHNLAVDATAYAKGMYILYLQHTENGKKHQTKFVKE